MTKDQECYNRHSGKVWFQLGREEVGKKDGQIDVLSQNHPQHYEPEDRFDVVRNFLKTWDSVSVFSVRENQHFLTYTKKNVNDYFKEVA